MVLISIISDSKNKSKIALHSLLNLLTEIMELVLFTISFDILIKSKQLS